MIKELHAKALTRVNSFEYQRAILKRLSDIADKYSDILQGFQRDASGLVPDEIANTDEYKRAKADYNRAFKKQRDFSAVYVKRFKKEIRAKVQQDREDKTKAYREKQSGDSNQPPKGYIRSLVPLIGEGKPPSILLFRESSAVKTINREDIGDVLIFKKNGYWYGHFKKYGFSLNGGKVKDKTIEQLVDAITNIKSSLVENWHKEVKNAPKAFDKIIAKSTVDKLKKISKNLNGRLSKKAFDTELFMVNDGIATFSDGESTVISKEKINIPNIHGMSIAELRSITGEIYIDEDGRFSDGEKEITTTYDFSKSGAITSLNPDIKIPITADTRKTLQIAVKAVDSNNPKFELNGLLIDVKDGKGKAIGTDTRRLTISKEFKVNGKDGKYIILPNHITKDTKSIEIDPDGSLTKSEADEFTIYTRNINGRYPDYERIVPQYPKNSVSFSGIDMAKIIKKEQNIILEFREGEIFVYSIKAGKTTIADPHRESQTITKDFVTIDKKIGTIKVNRSSIKREEKIAINPTYLVDAISGSKDATLEYNDPYTPIKVTADEVTTIIMPIVIKDKSDVEKEAFSRFSEKAEYEKKRAEKEAKEKAEYEATLKQEEGIAHDFLSTLTPQRRGSAKKTLSGMTRYDGEVLDNRDFVVKLIKEGRSPQHKEYKEWSRRLSKNIEKSEWGMQDNDGSWVKVTKTEADFAQYLIDNNISLDSVISDNRLTKKITMQSIMKDLNTFVLKDRPKEFQGVSNRRLGRLVMKLANELNINVIFDKDGDVYLYERRGEKDFRPEKLILDATLTEAIKYLRGKVSDKYSKIVTLDAINSITTPNETITIAGHKITIESKRGTIRSGMDESGKEWSNKMKDDYGFFSGTHSSDGEEIDVFISSRTDIKDIPSKPVFYLKQNFKDGTFDEDKFILGCNTLKEAQMVYYRNYEKGYKNNGSWHKVEFKELSARLKKLTKIYSKKDV